MNLVRTITSLGKAIQTGDWAAICACYEDLSGDHIAPPTSSGVQKTDLKSLLRAALEIVDPSPEPECPAVEDVPDATMRVRGRSRRKIRNRPQPNQPAPPVKTKTTARTNRKRDTRDDGDGGDVIDGDAPVDDKGEPIVTDDDLDERSAGKANAFGITPTLVTTPVYTNERQANVQKAKVKKHRPKPRMFDRVCSACEKTYQSKLDIGSRCPACLKSLRHK